MDTDLLNKYFQNKCSAEEILLINEWFKTPEGENYISTIIDEDLSRISTDKADTDHVSLDSENLYFKILAAKEALSITPLQSITITRPEGVEPHIPWYTQPWIKYAAVFTGVLMLAFTYWVLMQQSSLTEQTGFGETKTLTLPDGSTVILNGNTTLSYPTNWEADQPREVWLDGEAFFSITHKPDHQKFIVNTSDNFNVEVLGTTFNVLKRDKTTRVVLNTGKIKLHIKQQEEKEEQLLMNPGELVEFDDLSSRYIKRKVNPEAHSSWKSTRMIFENTSLAEILLLLEHTYGLTVEISDPDLLDQKLNGTIPNENVDILLEGLSQLFNIKITKDQNHVIIESE
jgi:ferric-dicitrate binding protein FerR (iron transport regulator)